MTINLYKGDCLEQLKNLDDNSVDSIVTDPPYGISFMAKKWDYDVPSVDIWKECLRVLKPGGYLLSFAGTRTQHRMACNIEDAGFEIRDMLAWIYGSGFPKSMNISKKMDELAGVEREVIGCKKLVDGSNARRTAKFTNATINISGFKTAGNVETIATSEYAKQWDGWGTALKPALEPITMARKPLSEKTIAENVILHGTGGINIDGCRVPTEDSLGGGMVSMGRPKASEGWDRPWMHDTEITEKKKIESQEKVKLAESLGRFPANLIHDGSEEILSIFPNTKSGAILPHHKTHESENRAMSGKNYARGPQFSPASEGNASRFFYCAKANKTDRNEGCEDLPEEQYSHDGRSVPIENAFQRNASTANNTHPTVKPTDLMRYLCRLVTQPNGTVLDPFMGSGSTGKAAVMEGFNFIGIDMEERYVEISEKRIDHAVKVMKTKAPVNTLHSFFE